MSAREKRLPVLLSDQEMAWLAELARAEGVSMAGWVRGKVRECHRRERGGGGCSWRAPRVAT